MARMSESCFSNRAVSARWLAVARGKAINGIPAVPVFSNIGEPESLSSLPFRKPQMVIYGGSSRLTKDRKFAEKLIIRACASLGISDVIGFGKTVVNFVSQDIRVENLGVVSPTDASNLLMDSRVGYLDYFDGYLAKSGIFAAYCSHGLVPLLLHNNNSKSDGLESGGHFLAVDDLPEFMGISQQQQIATNAHKWYEPHSVKQTAHFVATELLKSKSNVDLPVEK